MDQTTTPFPGGLAHVTAHQDATARLLMVEIEADELKAPYPVRVAIALDRSGSMSGDPFLLAQAAASRFVGSLGAADTAGVTTFGDGAFVVAPLSGNHASTVAAIARLYAAGGTPLYDGYRLAKEMLPAGSRVILLSDGGANVGAYTNAAELAAVARRALDKKGVSVTTVGLGAHYDEILLAEMAHEGGGSHYFAPTPAHLDGVFSLERSAMADSAFASAFVRVEGRTRRLGSVGSAETTRSVYAVNGLGKASLRLLKPDGHSFLVSLAMPTAFGDRPEVVLRGLTERAAARLRRAGRVDSPEAAAIAAKELRDVAKDLAAHSLKDEAVVLLVDKLEATAVHLEWLVSHFDHSAAASSRKGSYQAGHNVLAESRAYSADPRDAAFVRASVAKGRIRKDLGAILDPDPIALALLKPERWAEIGAAPILGDPGGLTLAMRDPRDRFTADTVAKETGQPVLRAVGPVSDEDLNGLLGL